MVRSFTRVVCEKGLPKVGILGSRTASLGVGKAWFGGPLTLLALQSSDAFVIGTRATLVVAAFVVTLFHFQMEPARWRFCYLPDGSMTAVAARVRDALFCTALAAYILPFKLGIPLRIALLQREGKFGLHFIGIILALDASITLTLWTAWTASCVWIAALHWQPPWYVWIFGTTGACLLAIVLASRARVRGQWFERWHAAISQLNRPKSRVVAAAAFVAVDVFSYGLRHAILVWLVTGDPDLALIGGAVGIVATFAGIVSGLPMGLVGYDATLIAMLAVAGIGLDQTLAVAVINRGLNMGSAAILGVPAAVRLGLGGGIVSILRRLRELSHGGN